MIIIYTILYWRYPRKFPLPYGQNTWWNEYIYDQKNNN